ncbi:DNA polymerase IV [Ruminococcus sp.]|uniref:DNA polymerase IV n=1 Tax=Ruminococcus sp. TaxID=41978 RepID=UPI003AF7F4DD
MKICDTVNSKLYKNDRAILHSDCNCFYASVECLLNPNIRDLPVAVSGDAENRHGIILAKNEKAKKYNVKTGEAIWQANKKCPQLLTVPARLDVYKKFSDKVRRIYSDYTDMVEPFGLDEAWLDISEDYKNDALTIAKEISQRVKDEIGITVSIGVSFNKIFAKFGSDYKKPDAITCITRDNYKTLVWNSPAGDLLYVGGATRKKLEQIGIYTIGDIANAPIGLLRTHLGKWGDLIYGFANGYDSSPVARIGEYSEVKSIGNSTTAVRDLKNLDDIKVIAYVLCDSVCRRMREQGFVGKTVCVSMRDTGLSTITRQHTLNTYTSLTSDITKAAMALFKENFDNKSPLRSIGVSVTDFAHNNIPRQMDIFSDERKIIAEEKLDKTLDKLKQRFGNYIIRPASLLTDRGLSAFNPKDEHTIHPVGYL